MICTHIHSIHAHDSHKPRMDHRRTTNRSGRKIYSRRVYRGTSIGKWIYNGGDLFSVEEKGDYKKHEIFFFFFFAVPEI